MLENLFNLIKEQAGDAVINNPVVPNEQNEAVVASATHSVAEELQGTLASGGLQNVLSLFSGGVNSNSSGGIGSLVSNPIVQSIIGNFTNKLTSNHGISSSQAGGIASSLIPGVISSLISKTNDPNNSSFDINSIIGSLSGGGSSVPAGGGGFDFNNILSKFGGGGLDSDGDGKVELSDIVSKVTGGAQQAQSGGGGLMDMIKGFIK
jgi:hypothetical protein